MAQRPPVGTAAKRAEAMSQTYINHNAKFQADRWHRRRDTGQKINKTQI